MDNDSKPGLIDRLTALLLREPGDRGQLAEILRGAYERNLMDADALTIIEGALAASDTRVTDVMIPRAQMDVIDIDDPMSEIIPVVINAARAVPGAVADASFATEAKIVCAVMAASGA